MSTNDIFQPDVTFHQRTVVEFAKKEIEVGAPLVAVFNESLLAAWMK